MAHDRLRVLVHKHANRQVENYAFIYLSGEPIGIQLNAAAALAVACCCCFYGCCIPQIIMACSCSSSIVHSFDVIRTIGSYKRPIGHYMHNINHRSMQTRGNRRNGFVHAAKKRDEGVEVPQGIQRQRGRERRGGEK